MELTDVRIETARLILRNLSDGDAPGITENVNDQDIARWTLYIPYPYPPDGAMDFIRGAKDRALKRESLDLAIVLKETMGTIGVISLMHMDWDHRVSGIGYWIGKGHWGFGLVPEAVDALTRFAFRELRFHRIQAIILSENGRSRRVLEKAGFRAEGTIRERYLKNGTRHDGTMFSILDHELARSPPSFVRPVDHIERTFK